jgi:periplasmic divalent cation tolerance protein
MIVVTAAGSREVAARLAGSAVRARLAASGQVTGPVDSFFWHLGEFGEGREWVVVLKTTTDMFDRLEAHLGDEHEWENPEIIGLPAARAAGLYLEWLGRSVVGG